MKGVPTAEKHSPTMNPRVSPKQVEPDMLTAVDRVAPVHGKKRFRIQEEEDSDIEKSRDDQKGREYRFEEGMLSSGSNQDVERFSPNRTEQDGNSTLRRKKRKYKHRKGESKLRMEQRLIEEGRRARFKEFMGRLLNVPVLFGADVHANNRGFVSGLKALKIWATMFNTVGDLSKNYKGPARPAAMEFIANVLSCVETAKQARSSEIKVVKRFYQKNLVNLYSVVSQDLSDVLNLKLKDLGSQRAKIGSIQEIDTSYAIGQRLVNLAKELSTRARSPFYHFFTPPLVLSLGLAYAADVLLSGDGEKGPLELATSIYEYWQTYIINPHMSVRDSDMMPLRHEGGDLPTLYRSIMSGWLLRLVGQVLQVAGMGQLFENPGHTKVSLVTAHRAAQDKIRHLESAKTIHMREGVWKRYAAVLKSLQTVTNPAAVSGVHEEIRPPLFYQAASTACFTNQETWQDLLISRDGQRSGIGERFAHASTAINELSESISSLFKESRAMNRRSKTGEAAISSREKGFQDICMVLEDGVRMIQLSMQLGTQLLLIPSSDLEKLVPDVGCSLTTNVEVNSWLSNMVKVLTLGLVGDHCNSKGMLEVYGSTISAFYFNRLDPKTGERLYRAPLRVRSN